MHPIHVIGLGVSPDDLSEAKSRVIAIADVLVAGERLLSRFRDHHGLKLAIKAPLEKVFEAIEKERSAGKKVVVLAEGDPGFFGIGRRLLSVFDQEQVIIHPNVTALQAAASRMKRTWDSIRAVSLHGRKDIGPLVRATVRNDMIGVFTDRFYAPARIAEELIARCADVFRMWVFENLGEEDERVGCHELEHARTQTFSALNFVILERMRKPDLIPHLGMDDDLYIHGSGLITKKEVRAVGLASLQIEPHHTVWDLGAGCGSISIEASLLAHEGAVFAIEKDDARVKMIRENIRRMGAYGVEVVPGTAPACLRDLPKPDRIFVGGGLGRRMEVLEETLAALKPGGRIVFHLVLLGSLETLRTCLRKKGWDYELIHVQVSRTRALAGDERLEPLNPVYVVGAVKPPQDHP